MHDGLTPSEAPLSNSTMTDLHDPVTVHPLTDEQKRRAALRVAELAPREDVHDLLEALGLIDYPSAPKQRNTTPIKHGERAGYTNRGCGKEGSPPCPAEPSCREENNAYFRKRRASMARYAARTAAIKQQIGANG